MKIRALAFFILLSPPLLLMAQEPLSICPQPSQKISSWNKCIGPYTYPNGLKYIGEWKNDSASGDGIILYPNHYLFVGQFTNDRAQGRGAIVDLSGNLFKAGYANSPEIGEQNYLAAAGYITPDKGIFSSDQIGPYVSNVLNKINRYLLSTNQKPISFNLLVDVSRDVSPRKPLPMVGQEESSQKKKCQRLGLSPGSDDFKLCMGQ